MKSTSLSVCVPLYKPKFEHLNSLLASIESIPKSIQTEAVFSFDGGSEAENREFEELIKSYKHIDSVIMNNSNRLGMVGNWNACIQASRNTFVLLVGQDDIIVGENIPFFLKQMIVEGQDAIFGIEDFISDSGAQIGDPRKSIKPEALGLNEIKDFSPGLVTTIGLVYGNVIADPCGSVIRRAVFDDAGFFSEDFAHAADIEFWLRLDSLHVPMGRLPLVLSRRRIHFDNATKSHVSAGVANTDRINLFEKYAATETDYHFNRALSRLWSHWAYDAFRVRKFFRTPKARFRGSIWQVLMAVASEILESSRLKSPRTQFRKLIEKQARV
jgi:glycosyltransferase involved in cell wall biosynthesis